MSLWRCSSDLDKLGSLEIGVDPVVYAYGCHSSYTIDLHPYPVVRWICVLS